ncbi:hypothetical protein [Defluviimonas sp. SAOS-178_SWC]|uniref:hypothetical protein n=1 Tax=Defluviimonas sp. SAOS-178_SWC TaxID=3121287 RepID=UPI0032217F5C
MKRGEFDWSPWLEDGETVVWSAKANMLPLWIMLFAGISVLLGVASGIHDGSSKGRIAAAMGPWAATFFAILAAAMMFVQNHYCATNRRLITLHFAPWLRAPKLSAISYRDAEVQVAPRRPTIVRNRETRKQILSMILSKNDEASLLDLVKQEHT